MLTLQTELYLLYLAGFFYALFSVVIIVDQYKQKYYKTTVFLAVLALLLHTASIGIRWARIGHGPFINLYEILTSNVWSLFLGFTLFIVFFRKYIAIARVVLPVIGVLLLWLLVTDPKDTHLPPTYNTIWLYFHVVSGKIFFSLLLLASGLAAYALLSSRRDKIHRQQPGIQLAHNFLAIAFVSDAFMLFFGAIWAQDAWGRYWAWDPLETWAFLTWLSIAFTLHVQVAYKKSKLFCWLILASFILAFLTFFGVPFISTAPHKGMI
jgi:ABC-type transport system involved in cytochrome c biogenesis permease subunit